MKCLLICKSDCIYADKAHKHLIDLKWDVTILYSINRKESIPNWVLRWEGDLILSFQNYTILTQEIINSAKIAAINFHPSLPKYPGSGGAVLSLLNEDSFTGITCHIMDEKIDHGEILLVDCIPIKNKSTLRGLMCALDKQLLATFIKVCSKISKLGIKGALETDSSIMWGGGKAYKMNEINKLRNVSVDIGKDDLELLIRSSGSKKNMKPYLYIHGHRFIYDEKDE
jgi:methionyl-tRNA formyltransferase